MIRFSEWSHQSTLPLKTISFLIHLHLSAAFYFWSSPSCPGSVGASIHCQTEQHPVCFALHITLRTTCTHTLHNPSGRVNLAHVNSYCLWNTSITNQACLWNSNTASEDLWQLYKCLWYLPVICYLMFIRVLPNYAHPQGGHANFISLA